MKNSNKKLLLNFLINNFNNLYCIIFLFCISFYFYFYLLFNNYYFTLLKYYFIYLISSTLFIYIFSSLNIFSTLFSTLTPFFSIDPSLSSYSTDYPLSSYSTDSSLSSFPSEISLSSHSSEPSLTIHTSDPSMSIHTNEPSSPTYISEPPLSIHATVLTTNTSDSFLSTYTSPHSTSLTSNLTSNLTSESTLNSTSFISSFYKDENFTTKMFYSTLYFFSRKWNNYKVLYHKNKKFYKIFKQYPYLFTNIYKKTKNISFNNIPKVLLIGYHSRFTLDLVYFASHVKCLPVMTNLVFYLPLFRLFLNQLHVIPSKNVKLRFNIFNYLNKKKIDENNSYENFDKSKYESQSESSLFFIYNLLKNEKPIMLMPGGVQECLKEYDQINIVNWTKIKDNKENITSTSNFFSNSKKISSDNSPFFEAIIPGYLRVILKNKDLYDKNIKIVPFYIKNSEKMFLTSPFYYDATSRLSLYYYNLLLETKLLIFLPCFLLSLFFSFGYFFLPLPINLYCYFSTPISIDFNQIRKFLLKIGKKYNKLKSNESEYDTEVDDEIQNNEIIDKEEKGEDKTIRDCINMRKSNSVFCGNSNLEQEESKDANNKIKIVKNILEELIVEATISKNKLENRKIEKTNMEKNQLFDEDEDELEDNEEEYEISKEERDWIYDEINKEENLYQFSKYIDNNLQKIINKTINKEEKEKVEKENIIISFFNFIYLIFELIFIFFENFFLHTLGFTSLFFVLLPLCIFLTIPQVIFLKINQMIQ